MSNTGSESSLYFRDYSQFDGSDEAEVDQSSCEHDQLKDRYLTPQSSYHPSATLIDGYDGGGSDLDDIQAQIDGVDLTNQKQFTEYRSAEGRSYFDAEEKTSNRPILDKRWRTSREKYQRLKKIDDGRGVFSSIDRNAKRDIQYRSEVVEILSGRIGLSANHPVVIRSKQRFLDIESTQQDVEGVTGVYQTAFILISTEHRQYNRGRDPELSAWVDRIRSKPAEVAHEISEDNANATLGKFADPCSHLDEIKVYQELLREFDLVSAKVDKIAKNIYGDEYIRSQFVEEFICSSSNVSQKIT